MANRIQSRRDNGCWQRNTLANTFGLSVEICPACGQCHPYGNGEQKPTTCANCGKPLAPASHPTP